MAKYFFLFLIALAFSLVLTPAVRAFAFRVGAIDLPGKRKIHTKPIPRLGGVAIFLSFNIAVLIAASIPFFFFSFTFLKGVQLGWLFAAVGMVLAIGIVDDIWGIAPQIKLIGQFCAALLFALTCYHITKISTPFGHLAVGSWGIPLTVLWIVGITNAVNLIDGLDGLAAGTSLIISLVFFAISLLSQNVGLALLSIALSGSIMGFLRYNFNPASIFLGDSGSYFLGFVLSIISLLASLKGTTAVAIMIPILALGLPLMDTVLSMLRRLLKSFHIMEVDRKKNKIRFFFTDTQSILQADKDHIHHRLVQMGFNQKRAVTILYSVSLALGVIAFATVYFQNMNYALILTTIGIAAFKSIGKLGYKEMQLFRNGSLLALLNSAAAHWRVMRVFLDMAFILLCYSLAFLLRFENHFEPETRNYFLMTFPVVLAVKTATFSFAGLYRAAWRYMGIEDMLLMLRSVFLGCLFSALVFWIIPSFGILSLSLLVIDFVLLFFFVFVERGSSRILEHLYISNNGQSKKILVYGVNRTSIQGIRELVHQMDMTISGFIDDDPRNRGRKVNGYPVLGSLDELEKILDRNPVSAIILSVKVLEEKTGYIQRICKSRAITLHRLQMQFEKIPFDTEEISATDATTHAPMTHEPIDPMTPKAPVLLPPALVNSEIVD